MEGGLVILSFLLFVVIGATLLGLDCGTVPPQEGSAVRTFLYRLWRAVVRTALGPFCAGMVLVSVAGAQELPCNQAVTPCATSEGWVITERHWAPGSVARDLIGGRVQAEVRYHWWRMSGRIDVAGIPGEYQEGHLETVRTIEAHVAVAFDTLTLPGDLSIGPAAGVGAAVSLDSIGGVRADTPKALTAGVGVRVSSPKGWAYAVVGQHQALRGIAAVVVWQMKASSRVANVGTFAIGSRSWVATTGIAVRFE